MLVVVAWLLCFCYVFKNIFSNTSTVYVLFWFESAETFHLKKIKNNNTRMFKNVEMVMKTTTTAETEAETEAEAEKKYVFVVIPELSPQQPHHHHQTQHLPSL